MIDVLLENPNVLLIQVTYQMVSLRIIWLKVSNSGVFFGNVIQLGQVLRPTQELTKTERSAWSGGRHHPESHSMGLCRWIVVNQDDCWTRGDVDGEKIGLLSILNILNFGH